MRSRQTRETCEIKMESFQIVLLNKENNQLSNCKSRIVNLLLPYSKINQNSSARKSLEILFKTKNIISINQTRLQLGTT